MAESRIQLTEAEPDHSMLLLRQDKQNFLCGSFLGLVLNTREGNHKKRGGFLTKAQPLTSQMLIPSQLSKYKDFHFFLSHFLDNAEHLSEQK